MLRILSLAGHENQTLVTTALCLAIAFYFAEKKHGSVLAKSKIELLAKHIEIATCGEKEVILTLQNKKILDFEDGLQYYAAVHLNCNYIITNDIEDFYFSDIEVIKPEALIDRYLKS